MLASNSNQYKDSCNYSIDLVKQFITLASAGLAFLVGTTISGKAFISITLIPISMILLVASIAFGLLFVMNAISHVNESNNYDVYTTSLRRFPSLQILCFGVAICIIGYGTYSFAKVNTTKPTANLEIIFKQKVIKKPIFPLDNVTLIISGDDILELRVDKTSKSGT